MNRAQAAWQPAFAAALLDPQADCPPQLRAWNGSDAGRRFDVHRNNVLVSLVDALAETFPVVQQLVGEAFFRAMAAAFVRAQPPTSPVLHAYGAGLPAFLDGFAPAASVPFLADVARLEWARVEACHAADAPVLDPARVAWDADRAGELRFVLHPAARIVSSPHPVVAIWAAHQGEGEPAPLQERGAQHALVTRPALEVWIVACDAGTAAFARALSRGENLEAAALAAAAYPTFDLAAALAMLLRHGALTRIAA